MIFSITVTKITPLKLKKINTIIVQDRESLE